MSVTNTADCSFNRFTSVDCYSYYCFYFIFQLVSLLMIIYDISTLLYEPTAVIAKIANRNLNTMAILNIIPCMFNVTVMFYFCSYRKTHQTSSTLFEVNATVYVCFKNNFPSRQTSKSFYRFIKSLQKIFDNIVQFSLTITLLMWIYCYVYSMCMCSVSLSYLIEIKSLSLIKLKHFY